MRPKSDPADPAPAGAIAPWAAPADAVLRMLGVARERGLAEADVRARAARFGPNRLRQIRRKSALAILADQFASRIVALLAGAAALSLAFGRPIETLAIVVVLALNGAIGFWSELGAVRSMEALRRLGSVRARVRRAGRVESVDAAALVPGDVVVLEGGDVVTADLRLLEASRLEADESLLTGESLPVAKSIDPCAADAPVAERRCMLFKGTAVTRGAGEAVVVATGMATELGRISRLVEEAEDEITPLEKRLDRLGERLIWLTLAIAAGIGATALSAGKDWLLTVETAIALAVATVPEGLPIIATLALARGMHRMARRNALVNRLSAVEALGATGIIFTDKTGTLTENRMTVVALALATGDVEVRGEGLSVEGGFAREGTAIDPAAEPLLRRALELGVLCNDASFEDGAAPTGDPLEIALLVAGRKAGLVRARLVAEAPEVFEVAFEPALKLMATVHRAPDGYRVVVKGAPEAVLARCTRVAADGGDRPLDPETRADCEARNEAMAGRGLRVLAVAERTAAEPPRQVYEDLALVGLVGLLDPPRAEVREAIRACRDAGIRVVMVTGDQAATARTIAHAVGLVDDDGAEVVLGADLARADARDLDASIFARVSPEQKLALIARQQSRGAIVAMTGDGVNDAPALKKADIGVAMGQRGTEVARQAADIVLRDDAFASIVAAVEEGRVIFGNIRKFVVYLLSCNISEILVVGIASAVNAPLPILPLQILFLNLVTDVFPALALGVGEGPARVMARPPRDPRERILERRHWRSVAAAGLLVTAAVLGALALALCVLGLPEREAVTISFLTLATAQLWHVFDVRSPDSGVVRNEIVRNRWVWAALVLCVALVLAALHVQPLADVLQIAPPSAAGWAIVAGLGVAPAALIQLALVLGAVSRRRRAA